CFGVELRAELCQVAHDRRQSDRGGGIDELREAETGRRQRASEFMTTQPCSVGDLARQEALRSERSMVVVGTRQNGGLPASAQLRLLGIERETYHLELRTEDVDFVTRTAHDDCRARRRQRPKDRSSDRRCRNWPHHRVPKVVAAGEEERTWLVASFE